MGHGRSQGVDLSQLGTEDADGTDPPFKAAPDGPTTDALVLLRSRGANTFRSTSPMADPALVRLRLSDGSVLQAHSARTFLVPHGLTLERTAAGSKLWATDVGAHVVHRIDAASGAVDVCDHGGPTIHVSPALAAATVAPTPAVGPRQPPAHQPHTGRTRAAADQPAACRTQEQEEPPPRRPPPSHEEDEEAQHASLSSSELRAAARAAARTSTGCGAYSLQANHVVQERSGNVDVEEMD